MTSAEVDMNRHDIGEVEFNEDDPFFATENRRFVKREADQPRRSPMRRKDRWRQEEGMKTKPQRNHKKIQYKIKYNWQGEYG